MEGQSCETTNQAKCEVWPERVEAPSQACHPRIVPYCARSPALARSRRSPRWPRSWWRAPGCTWPSMATARFRASAAAPICWRPGASASICRRPPPRAIREVGIGFPFAPTVHTAMKHAHPVRVDLKMRTVFNLLGPLTNPAGATAQLIGAPSLHAAELMAGAIAALGMRRGFVVHGSDGLDEITTTGPTSAWEIRDGTLESRTLEPADFAVHTARAGDLPGGD